MMVLDVQRVLTREPKAIEPLLGELRGASAAEPRLRPAIAAIEGMVADPAGASPAGHRHRAGPAGRPACHARARRRRGCLLRLAPGR